MRTWIVSGAAFAAGVCLGVLVRGTDREHPGFTVDLEDGGLYRVARVVDGDTVVLESGIHIRYIGADTPEVIRVVPAMEPWAAEATAANQGLVDGKHVRLKFEREKIDRYGRVLAHVYVGEGEEEKLVEQVLVERGLARARYVAPNVELYPRLKALEERARGKRLGIWAPSTGREKGTAFVASCYSRVFHEPGCSFAKKISKDNFVTFGSEKEVRATGRRPCPNCLGGERARRARP